MSLKAMKLLTRDARSDFIFMGDTPYFLELNSIPGGAFAFAVYYGL